MTTSSTNHMPYCTGHRDGGDLCVTKTWTAYGVRLELFGHKTDVPPTAVRVDTGAARTAYTPAEAARLGEALTAIGILTRVTSDEHMAYWTGRLDVLEAEDHRTPVMS